MYSPNSRDAKLELGPSTLVFREQNMTPSCRSYINSVSYKEQKTLQ